MPRQLLVDDEVGARSLVVVGSIPRRVRDLIDRWIARPDLQCRRPVEALIEGWVLRIELILDTDDRV